MINVNNFKFGLTFKYYNEIYVVIKSQHLKTARGKAFVKTKVKNLRNNVITYITFIGGYKVEKAIIKKIKIQYLYNNGINCFFMNIENYEQLKISLKKLVWEKNFLKEGQKIFIIKYNDEILEIILPNKINLIIMQVETLIKGNANFGKTKKAILETGFNLQVPYFIKKGEKIIISTSSGKYLSRY